MGSAFHQLCPRYSGTLTPTALTAVRLWEAFTFTFLEGKKTLSYNGRNTVNFGINTYSCHTANIDNKTCLSYVSESLKAVIALKSNTDIKYLSNLYVV